MSHTKLAPLTTQDPPMEDDQHRRSPWVSGYDSNGRDYLANLMGCSRRDLDNWLMSSTVRPHLQLWYHTCISGPSRFNDAVEWINTGENGYFYNPENLEEDLRFLCLSESNGNAIDYAARADGAEISMFADMDAKSSTWITQELWARTAWRIVQHNKGNGQAFAKTLESHAAACYAFAIDLLCLAFHSIAFRGRESVYIQIIVGDGRSTGAGVNVSLALASEEAQGIHDDDDARSTTSSSGQTETTNAYDSDAESDADFADRTCSPATSFAASPGYDGYWCNSVVTCYKIRKAPELVSPR